MAKWKMGDRVKIASRQTVGDDHLAGTYYGHYAGLAGTITSEFDDGEFAVKVDPDSFSPLMADVHKDAVKRMRAKFLDSLSEEQRRRLSPEEKRFEANYMVIVKGKDLEKGPPGPKPAPKPAESEDADEYDGTSVVQGALYDDADVPETRRTTSDLSAAEESELAKRFKN
jgi:hypothetical protein